MIRPEHGVGLGWSSSDFSRRDTTVDDVVLRRFLRSLRAGYRAARAYRPVPLAQPMHDIRAGTLPEGCLDPAVGWSDFAAGVQTVAIESTHFDLFAADRLPALAAHVDVLLEAGAPRA